MNQKVWRYLISIGAIATACFLSAKLAFSALDLGIEASPLWPPAGVALAALIWQGQWAWLGVALGIWEFNASIETPLLLSGGSIVGNTLEAIVGVGLLQRIGFRARMERLQDVMGFVALAVLTAPLVNATIGTGVAYLTNYLSWSQLSQNWWTIWLGDGMGTLVFAPWLLSLQFRPLQFRPVNLSFLKFKSDKSNNLQRLHAQLDSQRLLEKLLWLALLSLISWAVFYSHPGLTIALYPLEFLPFPFVIWAALRFGQSSAVFASLLLSVIAIGGTAAGNGPFNAKVQDSHQVIFLLQAFIAVITITALILAAVTEERRCAETRLRQSEASLANAQSLARLGHWDLDFTQQQCCWSDELYRLLGFPLQTTKPCREAFLQAVHSFDRERVRRAMAEALEHRESYQIEYRIVLPDGSERIVEEQVVVGQTHATGTVQDITVRKQAEAEAQLASERNRLLSETALRIRQSLDLNEILKTTVSEVQQLLHADRVFLSQFTAEGRGKIVAESVVPGWASVKDWMRDTSSYARIRTLFADDHIRVIHDTSEAEHSPFIQTYYTRYQIRATIGVPLVWGKELFGILVVNQCSGPRHWQPIEVDLLEHLGTQVAIAIHQGQLYQQVQSLNCNLEQQVTERTLQLQASLAKLEELSQLQDLFLHAIAHDLRTTVMGNLMVLNNLQSHEGEKIPIPRSLLERMAQSGDVQLSKLNALLEAYTYQTEGVVLHRETVSLAPLVAGAIAELKPLFEQNQTVLMNQVSNDLPLAIADSTQLQRVFKQLLTNAVKHNPPGVEILLQATVEATHLCFTITDNGKGINPAQSDRLFDFRLSSSQDRQLTGICLGLYLCHQIITAHTGQIGVSSTPGQGSRFWFTLPIARLQT